MKKSTVRDHVYDVITKYWDYEPEVFRTRTRVPMTESILMSHEMRLRLRSLRRKNRRHPNQLDDIIAQAALTQLFECKSVDAVSCFERLLDDHFEPIRIHCLALVRAYRQAYPDGDQVTTDENVFASFIDLLVTELDSIGKWMYSPLEPAGHILVCLN